jgi:peptidoglycan/LPS O-acetylase OafA/YrhL
MHLSNNQTIAYRPEVDGLRAIAVMPVIFFHAGINFFSGGYVGVDIFFVISGYLITSIILKELEQGKFSIANFYERRARRILPALFFVILCCLPFAWLWMLPDELKRFGQSILAVVTFSSNIYFWQKTDYFSPVAEELPLLHTWSLAVEEQYYLLFPIFLMVFWRLGRRRLFWLLVLAAIVSVGIAEWGSRHSPVGNFYLLPSRAWEIFAGSLLAFLPTEKAINLRSGSIASFGSIVGLALIGVSIFGFDNQTQSPGLITIVPVLGAVLVILFSSNENAVGRILSNTVLVNIGLFSYSAYLVHQPILAFYRIYLNDYLPRWASSIYFVLASIIITAIVSKVFIEDRFRSRGVLPRRIFAVSFFFISALSMLGVFINFNSNLGRFSQSDLAFLYPKASVFSWEKSCREYIEGDDYDICYLGAKTGKEMIVLHGDSHMWMLISSLHEQFAKNDTSAVYFRSKQCSPLYGFVEDSVNQKKCADIQNAILLRELELASGFLIAVRWNWSLYPLEPHVTRKGFDWGECKEEDVNLGKKTFVFDSRSGSASTDSTIEKVKVLNMFFQRYIDTGKQVSIVLPVPELGCDPVDTAAKMIRQRKVTDWSVPSSYYYERNKFIISYFSDERFSKSNVAFINPTEGFCESNFEGGACYAIKNSNMYYADDDHLSDLGASVLVGQIFNKIYSKKTF